MLFLSSHSLLTRYQPETHKQQPATSNQQPATSNQQPATSDKQPATSNQQRYSILAASSSSFPRIHHHDYSARLPQQQEQQQQEQQQQLAPASHQSFIHIPHAPSTAHTRDSAVWCGDRYRQKHHQSPLTSTRYEPLAENRWEVSEWPLGNNNDAIVAADIRTVYTVPSLYRSRLFAVSLLFLPCGILGILFGIQLSSSSGFFPSHRPSSIPHVPPPIRHYSAPVYQKRSS